MQWHTDAFSIAFDLKVTSLCAAACKHNYVMTPTSVNYSIAGRRKCSFLPPLPVSVVIAFHMRIAKVLWLCFAMAAALTRHMHQGTWT